MPQLGEIKRASEIGLKSKIKKYIYYALNRPLLRGEGTRRLNLQILPPAVQLPDHVAGAHQCCQNNEVD